MILGKAYQNYVEETGNLSSTTYEDYTNKPLHLHVAMYAFADGYNLPDLKSASAAFFADIVTNPFTSTTDLVHVIDAVYDSTPRSDLGLRKYLVFALQGRHFDLRGNCQLQEKAKANVDFLWDLNFKYAHQKHLWCINCYRWSDIPTNCKCGFHGLCKGLKKCTELDWTNLRCSMCKLTGRLTRERPASDDECAIIDIGSSAPATTSSSASDSSPKRRKISESWNFENTIGHNLTMQSNLVSTLLAASSALWEHETRT